MAEGGGGFGPGGGSMDHCICLCIRKFMEMIRTSQNICHDNGCLDELPSLYPASANGYTQIFFVLLIWVIVAAILFLYRPASLRGTLNQKPPPQGPSPDDDHTPPDINT